MAITSEFSLQNTTVEIFDNSTSTQQTALNALRASLKTATTEALRVAAFNTFFSTAASLEGTVTLTGTFTSGTTAGGVAGTWTDSSTSSSGRFISTGVAGSTTVAAGVAVDTIGTLSAPATVSGAAYTTTRGGSGSASGTATITSTSASDIISKITAIGDTGKTYATISAKLVSESGTLKAKGSSDEGDLTIDYISIPSDAGQALMELAFDDQSINGNRVFRLIHTASGAAVYCVGMVTELKKTRGSVDNFASVKAKITLQDGLAEYNPA